MDVRLSAPGAYPIPGIFCACLLPGYIRVHPGTYGYIRDTYGVHPGTYRVHPGTYGYIRIQPGTSRYIRVHSRRVLLNVSFHLEVMGGTCAPSTSEVRKVGFFKIPSMVHAKRPPPDETTGHKPDLPRGSGFWRSSPWWQVQPVSPPMGSGRLSPMKSRRLSPASGGARSEARESGAFGGIGRPRPETCRALRPEASTPPHLRLCPTLGCASPSAVPHPRLHPTPCPPQLHLGLPHPQLHPTPGFAHPSYHPNLPCCPHPLHPPRLCPTLSCTLPLASPQSTPGCTPPSAAPHPRLCPTLSCTLPLAVPHPQLIIPNLHLAVPHPQLHSHPGFAPPSAVPHPRLCPNLGSAPPSAAPHPRLCPTLGCAPTSAAPYPCLCSSLSSAPPS